LRKQIHEVIECRLQQEDFKKEIGIENTGMVFGKQTKQSQFWDCRIKRIARDRKVEKRQLVMAALVAERPIDNRNRRSAVCDSLCASMRNFLRRLDHSIRKR
jgi:hypothetical protein